MKNYLRPARRAVARDCDTELCATSAKEKAIDCLSTVIRLRCNSNGRSDGNARARRRTLGIPAECLAAFAALVEWQDAPGGAANVYTAAANRWRLAAEAARYLASDHKVRTQIVPPGKSGVFSER